MASYNNAYDKCAICKCNSKKEYIAFDSVVTIGSHVSARLHASERELRLRLNLMLVRLKGKRRRVDSLGTQESPIASESVDMFG